MDYNIMPLNQWNQFQQLYKGSGLTKQEICQLYKLQQQGGVETNFYTCSCPGGTTYCRDDTFCSCQRDHPVCKN